jgi:hypothetical protein
VPGARNNHAWPHAVSSHRGSGRSGGSLPRRHGPRSRSCRTGARCARRSDHDGMRPEVVPPSAWRQVELDVPTRKFRFPTVHDTKVQMAGGEFRQLVIKDLGHEQPTVLLTNDRKTSAAKVIPRYARRMLIENAHEHC